MVVLSCPRKDCDYQTEDLQENNALSLIQLHAADHPQVDSVPSSAPPPYQEVVNSDDGVTYPPNNYSGVGYQPYFQRVYVPHRVSNPPPRRTWNSGCIRCSVFWGVFLGIGLILLLIYISSSTSDLGKIPCLHERPCGLCFVQVGSHSSVKVYTFMIATHPLLR